MSSDLEEIFRLVAEREGVDLCCYRQNTVERRVASRLQRLRCRSYEEYAAMLARDPAESRRLIEHVTIKVSRFFRDAPVYDMLRDEVLPDLWRTGDSRPELRIWSAGCGCGEEPYSLAILVKEMAKGGLSLPDATIVGTDLDERALAVARSGLFSEAALAETPPDLVARYFTPQPGRLGPRHQLASGVRESVEFRPHNLLSGLALDEGRPFSLLLCRNVLIYFTRPAQEQVLRLLVASVEPGGYLCLGEAEQLATKFLPEFRVIDRHARLYRKL